MVSFAASQRPSALAEQPPQPKSVFSKRTENFFGSASEKKIYVTEYEKGHVLRYDVDAAGFELYG